MWTLDDSALVPATVTVKVRGRDVVVRGLSVLHERRLVEAMGGWPAESTGAEEKRQWLERYTAARIAAATDLRMPVDPGDGSTAAADPLTYDLPHLKAYVAAAGEALLSRLTTEEVMVLREALARVQAGQPGPRESWSGLSAGLQEIAGQVLAACEAPGTTAADLKEGATRLRDGLAALAAAIAGDRPVDPAAPGLIGALVDRLPLSGVAAAAKP